MGGTVALLDFSEFGSGTKSKSKFSNRVARISLLLGYSAGSGNKLTALIHIKP